MALKDWHAVQLGLLWILLALFGLPIWLLLAMLADWLAGRYSYQEWFDLIPTVLAFVVAFGLVGLGLGVTLKWLEARQGTLKE